MESESDAVMGANNMKISIPEVIVLGGAFFYAVWFAMSRIFGDLPDDYWNKRKDGE